MRYKKCFFLAAVISAAMLLSGCFGGVEVGDRAYIAAGSTITEDIPEGSMSIARNRQVNKIGWADEHKKY